MIIIEVKNLVKISRNVVMLVWLSVLTRTRGQKRGKPILELLYLKKQYDN